MSGARAADHVSLSLRWPRVTRALRMAWALLALVALPVALPVALTSGACLEPDAASAPVASGSPSAPVAPLTPATRPPSARPGAPPATSARTGDPTLARLAAKPLRYTRHGRCRMDCRHITEAEVAALLADGRVAPERTRHDGECVSYAVEGRTDDGQDVRIVYADCDRETRVVTTIDLGHDWPCSCR